MNAIGHIQNLHKANSMELILQKNKATHCFQTPKNVRKMQFYCNNLRSFKTTYRVGTCRLLQQPKKHSDQLKGFLYLNKFSPATGLTTGISLFSADCFGVAGGDCDVAYKFSPATRLTTGISLFPAYCFGVAGGDCDVAYKFSTATGLTTGISLFPADCFGVTGGDCDVAYKFSPATGPTSSISLFSAVLVSLGEIVMQH